MPTAPTAARTSIVPADQQRQYHDEGYMVLERVIPADLLQMLREECSYFIGYADAELDMQGQSTMGITHRGSRYFIGNKYRLSQRLWRFIYSDVMAEVVRAALGDEAYLFNEQWVVKGAEKGMPFAWHQDSGYVKHGDPKTTHKPYLTCWCTLDDVTEENGTVYVLPHSRAGTRDTIFDHQQQEKTNDLVGYTGNDPGDPVIAPAGSVVAFSSYLFHRSGANQTRNMRRIYLPQYSATPILHPEGGLWAQGVPFLQDGKNVYDHAQDTAERYGGHPAPGKAKYEHGR